MLKFIQWLFGEAVESAAVLGVFVFVIFLADVDRIGRWDWIAGLIVFLGVAGFFIAKLVRKRN